MSKKKGFTLVELLAVVIILGIISIIIYPVLNKVLKDNRKKAFEASLDSVVRAAELYKADNNNNLDIIDYDDGTIDISNLGKWKTGTISDGVDTDGLTKIYLAGFYDGEFCATGFSGNLTIVEGECESVPQLCFIMENNTITDYGFEYSACPLDIVIPTKVYNEDVLYIGTGAFSSSIISSVIIPNSIKEIGNGAFSETMLTSLDLTNATSLEKIGASAFSGTYLSTLDLSNLSSLKEIGENAFRNCNLSSVTIPSLVTSIGSGAFYKYDSYSNPTLTSIVNKSTTPFNWYNILNVGTSATCTFAGAGTCGTVTITTS